MAEVEAEVVGRSGLGGRLTLIDGVACDEVISFLR